MLYLQEVYNYLIGDNLKHRQWLEREKRFNELSQGINLNNVSELNGLARVVEKELNITEVSVHSSRHYETISPAEFYAKRRKTVEAFDKLK